MVESKNPITIQDVTFPSLTLQNPDFINGPYPRHINFQTRDGTKVIERTDKLLGEGGQGCVYLGVDEECEEYAIKIIDLSKYNDVERPPRLEDYYRELKFLQNVKSDYVAKFYGDASDADNHQYYLLLEYCNSDL
jgi:hypothetical protein